MDAPIPTGLAPKLQKNRGAPKIRMPLFFYLFTFLLFYLFTFSYIPIQDVAPRAVRMADATEAMICTTHLMVSFLVIRV